MDNDTRKKNMKDIKLAPTKGVRKPGVSRPVNKTGNGTAAGSSNVTFKRVASPKASDAGTAPRARTAPTSQAARPSASSASHPVAHTAPRRDKDDDLDVVVSVKKSGKTQTQEENIFSSGGSGRNVRRSSVTQRKIRKTGSAPKVILLLLCLIAIIFVSSFVSYTYLVDKYNNPIVLDSIVIDPATKVSFKIEKGNLTSDIAKSLSKQDLIGSATIYRFLSKFNGYDGNYKAGTYTLCKGLSYEEIMVILSSNPESVKVTIPEGFTTKQIANRLEANKVCSAKAFLEAVEKQDLTSYTFITSHKNRDYRLDGYLFPDTYEFDIDENPETIIYKLLNRFNEMYQPDYYTKAESIGLTQDQVIILASLVEKEAKLSSERPRIAGVFINRLHSDSLKKLQSCATIRYAYAKRYGTSLETVTKENTTISDLYNTYAYEGLPPGPICNPGKESIEAVLNYEHHDYYYFVARTDKSNAHTFSRTYEEHVNAKGF